MQSKRECDGCTACCDGELILHIHGKRYAGRPCQFNNGSGCTIYKDRPHNPCKTFKCSWLKDEDYTFPEWLKPNKSGFIIMDKKTENGIPYKLIVTSKKGHDEDALLWLITWGNENNINLKFLFPRVKHHIGSKEFRDFYKHKK